MNFEPRIVEKDFITQMLDNYKSYNSNDYKYIADKIKIFAKTAAPFSPGEIQYYFPKLYDFLKLAIPSSALRSFSYDAERLRKSIFESVFCLKRHIFIIDYSMFSVLEDLYGRDKGLEVFLINEECYIELPEYDKKKLYKKYFLSKNLTLYVRERVLRAFFRDYLRFDPNKDHDDEIMGWVMRDRLVQFMTESDIVFFKLKYGEQYGK